MAQTSMEARAEASLPAKKQRDVIVVGSGPGGATLARELARAGKAVTLLERGRDHRGELYYGTHLGALIYGDRGCLLFTEEGLNVVRPLMTGGATNMFTGSAARPPPFLKEKYGVDIDLQVEETIEELGIAPLPDASLGTASKRIMEAGNALGYDWQPLLKFMHPSKTPNFDCGAKCMLGCRCGAKWTANEYVDDAVAAGCELITRARVDELMIEDGQVVGVKGKIGRRTPFQIQGEVVVLAGGGIGTPIIMQNSGFFEAGHGIAMDTTTIVYGVSKHRGLGFEPPMSVAYTDDENGYMLSTLMDPWLLYPLEGRISKPLTPRDRFRLNHASIVARKILVKAGCDPDSIFVGPLRGTHPCATVRLGQMLDQDLQSEVKNLYVCDASSFPEALDRPTVLTIIGLARRLSQHLLNGALAG